VRTILSNGIEKRVEDVEETLWAGINMIVQRRRKGYSFSTLLVQVARQCVTMRPSLWAEEKKRIKGEEKNPAIEEGRCHAWLEELCVL